MNLVALQREIESILPADVAMKGDRIGLQLQSGRHDVSSILCTMEVTDEVVTEAIEGSFEAILSFHPLIFSPLLSIEEHERVGRICTALIQHKIALLVAHTNFDAYHNGTNTLFAERIGLKNRKFLVPDGIRLDFGMGIVGEFDEAIPVSEFLFRLREVCRSPIRWSSGRTDMIRTVALVGGSGMSFYSDAVRSGADAFITADVKYHDFHRAKGEILLADPGHFEMEQFVADGLLTVVQNIVHRAGEQARMRIQCSQISTNPVHYYVSP